MLDERDLRIERLTTYLEIACMALLLAVAIITELVVRIWGHRTCF